MNSLGIKINNLYTGTVPVVYMAHDVMILTRANPFRGSLNGGALKITIFFIPEMATSEASAIWARKSQALHLVEKDTDPDPDADHTGSGFATLQVNSTKCIGIEMK
jgi:hypothetical protein